MNREASSRCAMNHIPSGSSLWPACRMELECVPSRLTRSRFLLFFGRPAAVPSPFSTRCMVLWGMRILAVMPMIRPGPAAPVMHWRNASSAGILARSWISFLGLPRTPSAGTSHVPRYRARICRARRGETTVRAAIPALRPPLHLVHHPLHLGGI